MTLKTTLPLILLLTISAVNAYTETTIVDTQETCFETGKVQEITVKGYYAEGEECIQGMTCPGLVSYEPRQNTLQGYEFTATSHQGLYYNGYNDFSPLIQEAGTIIQQPIQYAANSFSPIYKNPERFTTGQHLYTVTYSQCSQQQPVEVPEMSTIIAGITITACAGILLSKRK